MRGDASKESKKVRQVLQPTPVEGQLPTWVRPTVNHAIDRGELPPKRPVLLSGEDALAHACSHFGGAWCDNTGRVVLDGVQVLVSEPDAAAINLEAMQQLETFCRILNCRYEFSANSEWHPGQTIRILVSPAE